MISKKQIESVELPFFVVGDCLRGKRKGLPRKQRPSKIIRFSGDPLNVGGGIFPIFLTAYFEGGGWVLLSDLMRHHSIVSANYNNNRAIK